MLSTSTNRTILPSFSLFVKKQKHFSLRDDFFGYNFPNFLAPMTLLFDQISYFKQWSENKYGMIA